MKKFARYTLILFAVGLIAASAAIWSMGQPFQPSSEKFVRIEHGLGTAAIARTLQQAGVIRYEWQIFAAHLLNPSAKLQAGEYRFAQPSSALAVFDRIRRGDVYFFEFTVPEGSNRWDIARLIESTGIMTAGDFLKASAAPSLISDLAPNAPSLEGFLFPSTYRLRALDHRDG